MYPYRVTHHFEGLIVIKRQRISVFNVFCDAPIENVGPKRVYRYTST